MSSGFPKDMVFGGGLCIHGFLWSFEVGPVGLCYKNNVSGSCLPSKVAFLDLTDRL